MYRSIEIDEESRERLGEAGEEGIPVAVLSLMFEMPAIHERPTLSTLEWADGGDTPFSESGGSEGRRADDGGPAR